MLFVSFDESHALSGILQICVSYFILFSMKTKYNFTYVHKLFSSRLLFQFWIPSRELVQSVTHPICQYLTGFVEPRKETCRYKVIHRRCKARNSLILVYSPGRLSSFQHKNPSQPRQDESSAICVIIFCTKVVDLWSLLHHRSQKQQGPPHMLFKGGTGRVSASSTQMNTNSLCFLQKKKKKGRICLRSLQTIY